MKLAWKLPQSKETSQVKFSVFSSHLLKQSLGATCSTENTRHFTQPQGLGSARPGNRKCSRAASWPQGTLCVSPPGNCSSFQLLAGGPGEEPPMARSQSCTRYETMDLQRLNPASAEGWTGQTWNKVGMALSRAELPLLPHGPESCGAQS